VNKRIDCCWRRIWRPGASIYPMLIGLSSLIRPSGVINSFIASAELLEQANMAVHCFYWMSMNHHTSTTSFRKKYRLTNFLVTWNPRVRRFATKYRKACCKIRKCLIKRRKPSSATFVTTKSTSCSLSSTWSSWTSDKWPTLFVCLRCPALRKFSVNAWTPSKRPKLTSRRLMLFRMKMRTSVANTKLSSVSVKRNSKESKRRRLSVKSKLKDRKKLRNMPTNERRSNAKLTGMSGTSCKEKSVSSKRKENN